MPMEYPQVIMAIKQWIGQNKISTDTMVKVSDNNAARQATLGEMLIKFATQAFGTLTGGADGLPAGALKDAVTAVGSQVKDVMSSFSGSLESAFGGSSFGSYFYQNPVAFEQDKLTAMAEIYSNPDIAPEIQDAARDIIKNMKPDGVWNQIVAEYNQFTNELSGLSAPSINGYNIKDAINLGVDKTNAFFSSVTGLKNFDVGDFASTVFKPDYMQKFNEYHDRALAAASMPETTPIEKEAKKQEILTASAGMDEAAKGMKEQVASDKQNYTNALAHKTAIDTVVGESASYDQIMNDSSLSDAQKASYQATLKPETLANVQSISSLNAASTKAMPDTTLA